MNSNTQDDPTDDVQSLERTAWVADILRNRRRIQVILELNSAGEDGLTIGELADRIAEREHGPQYSPEARKSVYVALYQSHAPKLNTWDVIDRQPDTAKRGRRFEEVFSALYRLQG